MKLADSELNFGAGGVLHAPPVLATATTLNLIL